MSGFDNLYRTDVLLSQNAQFYDAQRYRSMSEMGQAIGSLPERIQGMQMRRQDMMAQREMMEMNRVRLESDMRLQEATIEAQFHKNKIATMMAVDDAKRSRLDVEQRQIANRMASLQSRQLERQLETADEDFQTNVATRLLSVGARDLAEYGIGIATQGRGLAARQLDEDERDRILSMPYRGADQERLARMQKLRELEKAIEFAPDAEAAQEAERRLLEFVGMPPGDGPAAPLPQIDPAQSAARDMFRTSFGAPRNNGTPYPDEPMPVPKQDAVADYLFRNRKRLLDVLRSDAGPDASGALPKTEDEAMQLAMRVLANPNDPWFAQFANLLVMAGVLTPTEAQAYATRFKR